MHLMKAKAIRPAAGRIMFNFLFARQTVDGAITNLSGESGANNASLTIRPVTGRVDNVYFPIRPATGRVDNVPFSVRPAVHLDRSNLLLAFV